MDGQNRNNRKTEDTASFGRQPVNGNGARRPQNPMRGQGSVRRPPENILRGGRSARPTGQGRTAPPKDIQRPTQIPIPMNGQNRPPMNGREMRRPKKPEPPREQTSGRRPTPPRAPSDRVAKKPVPRRNIILFSVFAALLMVVLIIVGVQSCTGKKNSKYSVSGGNDSAAETVPVTTAYDGAGILPTFAEVDKNTADLDIESEYGILIDLDSNKVIAEKNAYTKIYPASMTKIMTLIVAYEQAESMSLQYTFTADIIDPLFEEGASVAGFEAGETVTVADLIYGAALPSGADATNALAEIIGGSEDGFAVLMNQKVSELGLRDTHFVTASGLHDDNHYSTCFDMATILEYAISIPYLRTVLGTYIYTTTKTEQHPDGITLTNTMYNRMSGDETDGIFVQGGKTGYTPEARNCLASFAANCSEDQSAYTEPRYIMVSAYAIGEYTPVFDALNTYKKYCVSAE